MLIKCRNCEEKFEKETMIKDESDKNFCSENCIKDFEAKQKNKEQWNELYEYLKSELFNGEKLTSLMVHRLQAIRKGSPVNHGDTIPYKQSDGTNYKIILIAFKYKQKDIISSVRQKSFQTEVQKFNYICAIVENSLPDVKKKIKEKQIQNKQLKQIENSKLQDVNIPKTEEYVKSNDLNRPDSSGDKKEINKELENLW